MPAWYNHLASFSLNLRMTNRKKNKKKKKMKLNLSLLWNLSLQPTLPWTYLLWIKITKCILRECKEYFSRLTILQNKMSNGKVGKSIKSCFSFCFFSDSVSMIDKSTIFSLVSLTKLRNILQRWVSLTFLHSFYRYLSISWVSMFYNFTQQTPIDLGLTPSFQTS